MENKIIMKSFKIIYLFFLIFILGCKDIQKKKEIDITTDINKLIAHKKLDIGISIRNTSGDEIVSVNSKKKYRLYSVSKFFLALYILNQVDKGKLDLNQIITFSKKDLKPDLYSPLRDSIPQGARLSLKKTIKYLVEESDNNVFNKLADISGGLNHLNVFVYNTFRASKNEFFEMYDYSSSKSDFEANSITPNLATEILYQLEKKEILSNNSYRLLKKYMEHSAIDTRIQGIIKNDTKSFHKAGTSDRENGVMFACNDIGIVNLKNGTSFMIGVFISDSKEDDKTNDTLIAQITEIAYKNLDN
ncbi:MULTISPECIES: serine hydrolase [unclassified Chryseobacterium]|uniref:serine hydrolase n=1 Tax=unclassified Chryseobacterium TaxID=2593645 RepID=UPI000F45AC27|nr:serine hydrolase [Chryseobacterium sp. G0240]ROI04068.1 hypothetical protein EGI16_09705 [Chryseobacterium sp. G0240]